MNCDLFHVRGAPMLLHQYVGCLQKDCANLFQFLVVCGILACQRSLLLITLLAQMKPSLYTFVFIKINITRCKYVDSRSLSGQYLQVIILYTTFYCIKFMLFYQYLLQLMVFGFVTMC